MSVRRQLSIILLFLALGAVAAAAPSVFAQGIPDGAFSAMRWRLIGPFRGGRTLAVAGIAGNTTTFFFGAVDGGVWHTMNAALTWEPLFDAQPISAVGAMAVAPSDPKVIYVGMGEASLRSDITFGNGVYKSVDGGAHWEHVGLDDTRQIGKVWVDPRNADMVLVAALGHAYGPNEERGVFRSTDGGRHWAKVLFKDRDTGAIDIASDPLDPSVIYASLYSARRTPWSQYPPKEGPGSGIYKSVDDGATWAPVAGTGLPAGPLGRIGLAVGRTAAGSRVYALVGAATGSGLYRSDDGGANWTLTSGDARITSRQWYFGRVFVDPTNADIVYAPNVSLLRSTDAGRTWTPIKGAPGGDDYHEMWIDPLQPSHLLVGTDQGTILSLDNGATWSSWDNQPTAQLYHVAVDDRFPYRVYGGQQDIGAIAVQSRGDRGQIGAAEWTTVANGESGYVVPDPLDSNVVYTGNTYGGLFRFDWVTGQAQDIAPVPLAVFGMPKPMQKYRFTWTSPLVFDPFEKHRLYFGAQKLLATEDGGLHWREMSPDLSRADASGVKGRAPALATAAQDGWGVIYTVAPSHLKRGTIWAGTDDGLVWVTTDGGKHWRNVTPPLLGAWSKIAMIEASPFDAGTAYIAVDRHRLDDLGPYIARTRDYGKTWTRIEEGIALNAYAHVVREDPVRRGLLYAGTELGAYVSFDDGDHWRSLQLNLPVASIRDLVVKGKDLVAATHGRSFWVLDDVSPLRELTGSALGARLSASGVAVHLARPAQATRIRRSVSDNTPLSPEVPHGFNPPAGAVIDYWFGKEPRGAVKIEILDAQGGLVRRVNSGDPATLRTDPPQISEGWLGGQLPPTKHAGHNRYVWDLRYAHPPVPSYAYGMNVVAGSGAEQQPVGPLVVPGTYRVRLIADGDTVTQPLRVAQDPRVHARDGALRAQLTLALAIWEAQADQYYSLQYPARIIHADVRRLNMRSLDPQARASILALDSAAQSVIASVDDGFASLLMTVESADRVPTQQAREAFAELRAQVGRERASWQGAVRSSLPALNAALEAEGLPRTLMVPASGRP